MVKMSEAYSQSDFVITEVIEKFCSKITQTFCGSKSWVMNIVNTGKTSDGIGQHLANAEWLQGAQFDEG